MIQVSPAGVAAIRQREGCILRAYRDSVGVWTIGVGHTGRMSGIKVTAGMVITLAQADAFLLGDLAPVVAAIRDHVRVPLTQHQADALASLAFNIGVAGLIGSTVLHKLNAGDVNGAADAFLMWEKPAALKARREAERAQFLTADAAMSQNPAPPEAQNPGRNMSGIISGAPVSVLPPKSGSVVSRENQQLLPCTRPGCPLAAKVA